MKIDINVYADRANAFSDLVNLAEACLGSKVDAKELFQLLYITWESVSLPMWMLCYWSDYLRCGSVVLQVAETLGETEVEAQLLAELGYAHMEMGNSNGAEQFFNRSLQRYRSLQDYLEECKLLRYLGNLALLQHAWQVAIDFYYQAWQNLEDHCFETTGNKFLFHQAELANVIGEAYLGLTDWPQSDRYLNMSVNNYRLLLQNYPESDKQYYYYLTNPLINLGQWHFRQGDYPKAAQYYQESLQISQQINRKDSWALALIRLTELAIAQGEIDQALALATQAEKVAGTKIPSLRDQAALYKSQLQLSITGPIGGYDS